MICLRDHVTGDGLAAALLLCGALEDRTLAEAAAVMARLPQVQLNIPLRDKRVPPAVLDEAERLNTELDGSGRVLVRASGTEPLLRVLAEAETLAEAERLSARIGALVRRELG